MKNKQELRNKIANLDSLLSKDILDWTDVFLELKEYKDLLKYIDEKEQQAHSNAARPMVDSWYVGYWKAFDGLCYEVGCRE